MLIDSFQNYPEALPGFGGRPYCKSEPTTWLQDAMGFKECRLRIGQVIHPESHYHGIECLFIKRKGLGTCLLKFNIRISPARQFNLRSRKVDTHRRRAPRCGSRGHIAGSSSNVENHAAR